VSREDDQRRWAEREQALLATLRRTEAGFREFIDRCPDGVYVRRGSAVIHANAALLRLLGVEWAEIEGRDMVRFVHPENREAVLDHRARHADDTDLREHRWVRKDGELLFVEVVGVTVTFEGAPARVVMCRDVTERRKMQAGLMVANQLASIGTLAAGIAHEINNPLASAIANLHYIAEELRTRPGDPGELPDIVADALAGLTQVRGIVAGLGTFARADEEPREDLELTRVLDAALELLSSVTRGRVTVVREYVDDALVLGDRRKLVQLFVNLLINAVQAIPERRAGRAEIRLATHLERPDKAVVSVRDTGVGIPPENLARIFDPFFTTRAVGDGLGLGLSIAHNIATGLGGQISVESQVGVGTTVTVVLPAAQPA
jgi:PAS domain S-box-containing protein